MLHNTGSTRGRMKALVQVLPEELYQHSELLQILRILCHQVYGDIQPGITQTCPHSMAESWPRMAAITLHF